MLLLTTSRDADNSERKKLYIFIRIRSIGSGYFRMENKRLEKDKNLEIILQKSKLEFPDCKVYLFGSRARGDNQLDSDYDILIITKQSLSVKEKILARSSLRNLLAKNKIYADIIIQNEVEIERKKSIPGNIIYYAMPEAVLV